MKARRKIDILFWVMCVCFILNSCTYEDCPGDERIDYIPDDFHKRIKGLETHSQWIFTDGEGNFDTLTAQGPVTQDFWKHNDVCVSQEKIERKFRWRVSVPPYCDNGTEMMFLALKNEELVQFIFSSDVFGNGKCIHLETDYIDSTKDFLKLITLTDGFTTPYKKYKNAVTLPFLVNSHTPDYSEEKMIFNELDGLIGYTLNGDTMLLTSLKES